MNKKFKFVLILIFCFVLVSFMLLCLNKMKEFASAYSFCEDDMAQIEKCGCFPKEGNYSYLESMIDFNSSTFTKVPINISP